MSSKNGVLQKIILNCSKTLTSINSSEKLLFKIKTNKKNIKNLCKMQKDKIIFNLLHYESFVYGNSNFEKVTLTPKRFDIIIKNGYAYFYLKEEK